MADIERINLREMLAMVDRAWTPKRIAALNGQYVKLARFDGEFVWHTHIHEDELFLVLEGEIEIHFRDRVVTLGEGEMCVVPRGVCHKPVAAQGPASVLLFEPATTVNTGDAVDSRRIEPGRLERI